jgi:hypothetical protein
MREMLTLWDFIKNVVAPAPKAPAEQRRPVRRKPRAGNASVVEDPSLRSGLVANARVGTAPGASEGSMDALYAKVTREMVAKYRVRVRRWRTAMTGIAWQVRYRDGTVARLIEAPRPKGPMSAAVFLHEIGHHAIGFDTYRPRCLEEYHAWVFALRAMEEQGLNVTEAVRRRMHLSLKYAVDKARRRGLRALPTELEPYTVPWPGDAGHRRTRRAASARPPTSAAAPGKRRNFL